MALSGVAPGGRLTDAELAREPRMLDVIAWFDGWGQAHGMRPLEYPRLLCSREAGAWREGWAEGFAQRSAAIGVSMSDDEGRGVKITK